ncbi:hypothetical protein H2199_006546 [Coniosporium tulheliwenetii]|uniref:Uncharacterized protein n=1 Tax=Coniosporium tulheliwenetii TaxID=3383036 RepID=A0ACC2YVZ7_9PEZI|nr:hypothetical protein H2199_006546 [Cladosporium sp. JES 115]
MLLARPWAAVSLLATAALGWVNTASAQDDGEIKSIPLRTHSLQPRIRLYGACPDNLTRQPYLDSDMQSRWFDFGGDTIVRTDKYIRLTADRPSRAGWLFSRVPLTATNWEVYTKLYRIIHGVDRSPHFQIEVEFKIHGQGNLYGDGMAIWLTKQRGQGGQVFGSTDMFEGLGIFFDTYKNNRPGVVFPYVMAMLGDGKTPYDKANDGKANELAGCSARGIRNQHTHPTKARLTYFAEKSLSLELQYKSESTWTPCFDIPSVKIPSVAYLGFSAETGELSDNHDIISVQTKNLYSAGGTTDKSKPLSGSGGAGTAKFPVAGTKGRGSGVGDGSF